jgi:hypothetical protein
MVWRWAAARAGLDAAGRLIDAEQAERRNLFMVNPIEGNHYATLRTLVSAYQMLLPGEKARTHRHSPNALRLVLDVGDNCYTIVDGVRIDMEPGDVLLTPTRLYVRPALAAIRTGGVKAFAHITGGGLTDNAPRVLPEKTAAEIDLGSWPLAPVYQWLMDQGGVSEAEMLRTFNCGIGMVVVAAPEEAQSVADALTEAGELVAEIGRIVDHEGEAITRYTGSLRG